MTEKRNQRKLWVAIGFFIAFIIWTAAICFVDLRAIGPKKSTVGFATLNGFVHERIGANMALYVVTDWLGIVPLVFCLGFAILGLVQWIQRKKIFKVDSSLLILGVFYVMVIAAYFFFEAVVINYRPVLIDGCLEASYPSSTTMLVLCVMPTANMQLQRRIKNALLRKIVGFSIFAFLVFMVMGRIFAGVHWITDIIGGGLLSAGLVTAYSWAVAVITRLAK